MSSVDETAAAETVPAADWAEVADAAAALPHAVQPNSRAAAETPARIFLTLVFMEISPSVPRRGRTHSVSQPWTGSEELISRLPLRQRSSSIMAFSWPASLRVMS
jgi:hypothetical protein